ncbi:CoA ester lyase [Vineibacter terrae]|uniref:HpcH/HpaI aldolase/citrate lyase family protein n=1 Tax=Vineibacter terrae TaxID=2586908 RepID=UPI002E355A54|nr:CoA ester lyase [Vineibacter terrae]HEX2891970.1 CoA ester lyase [Vineibacter terrae]
MNTCTANLPRVIAARSLLFAPASRPGLLDKALAAGADIVCADLEDAVAPDAKDAARSAGVAFISAPHVSSAPRRAVRINSLRCRTGLHDMLALQDTAPAAATICLPKVESGEEVRWAADLLRAAPGTRLAAFVETAQGLERAFEIARSSPRLDFLVFGAVDFCADMNMPLEDEALAYARGRLAHAARAGGIDLLDVPCVDFSNRAEVERQARLARRLGFSGKTAIHPGNVGIINAVFSATQAEIEEAKAIVAAFEGSRGGVTTWRGKLVEEPVVKRMVKLLQAHAGAGRG